MNKLELEKNMKSGFTCPSCSGGTMVKKMISYYLTLSLDREIYIENVLHDVCDNCGDWCSDAQASKNIEHQIESKFTGYFKKSTERFGFSDWNNNMRSYFTDNQLYPILEGAD